MDFTFCRVSKLKYRFRRSRHRKVSRSRNFPPNYFAQIRVRQVWSKGNSRNEKEQARENRIASISRVCVGSASFRKSFVERHPKLAAAVGDVSTAICMRKDERKLAERKGNIVEAEIVSFPWNRDPRSRFHLELSKYSRKNTGAR